jgi:hypothetical protein
MFAKYWFILPYLHLPLSLVRFYLSFMFYYYIKVCFHCYCLIKLLAFIFPVHWKFLHLLNIAKLWFLIFYPPLLLLFPLLWESQRTINSHTSCIQANIAHIKTQLYIQGGFVERSRLLLGVIQNDPSLVCTYEL